MKSTGWFHRRNISRGSDGVETERLQEERKTTPRMGGLAKDGHLNAEEEATWRERGQGRGKRRRGFWQEQYI